MSDSGGANTRSLALLTNDQCNNLPDGKPSANCLWYVNPIRNKNWIWISLCSVHGLKASRNQISNNDLYHDGNRITFDVIKQLFHHLENESHTTLNVRELRRLKRSVAYPDNFTKQNVSNAKQPFVEDTISYLCQWLADKMACPNNFFDKVMKEYADQNGYVAEILEDKVELLKSHIEKMPGWNPKKYVFLNEI